MWREMTPDETRTIEVAGHEIVTYSFGEGDDVVLLLNGGPGLPCDYLRDSHACLVDEACMRIAEIVA
ncbi:MAG: proline iminopeptidase, partial [Hyphomicrobiales bacterium]